MSLKPIAFLQEDFHSEVLDFLFELITVQYPYVPIVLYNNWDRYNNKNLYKLKYSNLVIKNLKEFIKDLTDNNFQKCFVVSYDNIINLTFLINYSHKFVFIAHSPQHIELFSKYNLHYFSLTSLLSNHYMLPILHHCNPQINYTNRLEQQVNTEILDQMKQISINQDLTIVITLGYFQKDNKDLHLIHNLLDSKKILMLSFVPHISEELDELSKKNIGYIFVACNLSTSEILFTINYLNIKYLLFAPNENSKFYKESWSGSIAFAINNNLNLIMPKILSDYYKITTFSMIVYDQQENGQNIINNIQSRKINNNFDNYDLQEIRNSIWNNNTVKFLSYLMD